MDEPSPCGRSWTNAQLFSLLPKMFHGVQGLHGSHVHGVRDEEGALQAESSAGG